MLRNLLLCNIKNKKHNFSGNLSCLSYNTKYAVSAFGVKSSRFRSTEAFLQSSATPYVEQMYESWKKDPNSVHVSWQSYFKNVTNGIGPGKAFAAPPTLIPDYELDIPADLAGVGSSSAEILDHLKVQMLIRAYMVRGHQLAKLDPLGIISPRLDETKPMELDYSYYGFTQEDLDRTFHLGAGMLPGFSATTQKMTLREILKILEDTYCGSIGIEYTHIPDREQCDWLRSKFEIPKRVEYTKEQKNVILDRLIWSDTFERFVAAKYPSEKRFGLEGCEALIPGMKSMIDRAVELGVESVVMGMPHRGRLNVLSNVVRKPNESIFSEFSGSLEPDMEGSGDVKYHLGMNYNRPTPSGKRVHLSLEANPSHLEAVDPVVLGKVRAQQFFSNDPDRLKSLPVLLHGDAAFAAQGVVYEVFGFTDLPNYTTGGTIHIVVNNQIGFTTDPRFARSTSYCTDVAKTVHAPIFHVNGDDVEAVVYCLQLAAEWRQRYKKDVVVDIVCYRRHGHNEVDQPSFTQPLMYKRIAQQKPTLELYSNQLIEEGSFTREEIDSMKSRVWNILEDSYEKSKDYQSNRSEWVSSSWEGFMSIKELANAITPEYETGIKSETLKHIAKATSEVPKGFNIHPVLSRILKNRKKSVEKGDGIDWPTAEAMAFGSLLMEGNHVRLSGQDVERGTFSQRHAVYHDQENENQYVALNHLSKDQALFTVCNSSLSEFGTLGFELGYSLVGPDSLILWEAQFGDFANNAQCIIDQFIASGEKKWGQRTGLTLLLPHGFDGAGPEHSSCRLERFLELCDDDPYKFPPVQPDVRRQIQDCNMQVLYCSTPANYFHALRRQIHRDFRKPLVVATSKSLLRHPLCKSSLQDMSEGTKFTRMYDDVWEQLKPKEEVKKLILCTGQVYFTLHKEREAKEAKDVAIARIEQISPFPFDLVAKYADQYPNAEIVWTQEEPMNMGAWNYVQSRIETSLNNTMNHTGKRARCVARTPTGAVATGNKGLHVFELDQIKNVI